MKNSRSSLDRELCQFGDDESPLAVWRSWATRCVIDDKSRICFLKTAEEEQPPVPDVPVPTSVASTVSEVQ